LSLFCPKVKQFSLLVATTAHVTTHLLTAHFAAGSITTHIANGSIAAHFTANLAAFGLTAHFTAGSIAAHFATNLTALGLTAHGTALTWSRSNMTWGRRRSGTITTTTIQHTLLAQRDGVTDFA
jgi:hypothetical protein